MSSALLYSMTGVALFAIGLLGVVIASHIIRKILALNVIGVGIFMLLIALAEHNEFSIDSLPQAMVLTGIVIAAAGTALALNLMVRLYEVGKTQQDKL